MAERDVDIAICGAGPVGAACALFLVQGGIDASRIALIDARTAAEAADDDRMIAISHGTATLLSRLDAWRDDAARHATAIETIQVSHRGRFGRTTIDRRDHDVPALGYVIRHGDLAQALDRAMGRRGLVVRRPLRATGIDVDGAALRLSMTPPGGTATTLATRHVVHAEGGLFDRQQRRAIHRDYEQSAVTGFVTAVETPSSELAVTAFERFTEDGPIALLPAHEKRSDGSVVAGWSVVWCGKPEDAAMRVALSDDAFAAALHAAFGDRLGRFETIGARRLYALGLNAVSRPARARSPTCGEFAIGNAAQTLHPVAGQGLNLGFRDAHDLASLLVEADRATDVDAVALAARHVARRRIDRGVTVYLTDLMPRLFASPLAPVAAARGLALALLDVSSPLRGIFARQMMDGRR